MAEDSSAMLWDSPWVPEALGRHADGLFLSGGGTGGDGGGVSGDLLQGGGEPLGQAGQMLNAAAGGSCPLAHLAHHAAGAL